jgi:hypothetical protein
MKNMSDVTDCVNLYPEASPEEASRLASILAGDGALVRFHFEPPSPDIDNPDHTEHTSPIPEMTRPDSP